MKAQTKAKFPAYFVVRERGKRSREVKVTKPTLADGSNGFRAGFFPTLPRRRRVDRRFCWSSVNNLLKHTAPRLSQHSLPHTSTRLLARGLPSFTEFTLVSCFASLVTDFCRKTLF